MRVCERWRASLTRRVSMVAGVCEYANGGGPRLRVGFRWLPAYAGMRTVVGLAYASGFDGCWRMRVCERWWASLTRRVSMVAGVCEYANGGGPRLRVGFRWLLAYAGMRTVVGLAYARRRSLGVKPAQTPGPRSNAYGSASGSEPKSPRALPGTTRPSVSGRRRNPRR
jgi:hypothetical protein